MTLLDSSFSFDQLEYLHKFVLKNGNWELSTKLWKKTTKLQEADKSVIQEVIDHKKILENKKSLQKYL